MFSTPNQFNDKIVHNFKSRARARHETFNGRIKKYNSMKETFEHSTQKHKLAFEAIVVTIQYTLDNASHLFDI